VEPIDYLRALRRRWAAVAACLVVALGVGFVMSRGTSSSPSAVTSYTATTVLVDSRYDPTSFAARSVNLVTVAAIAKVGEVPRRVARALGGGDPRALAARVSTSADPQTGFLYITARAPRAAEAARLADTFARELLAFLEERELRNAAQRVDALNERLDELSAQVEDLDRRIESATGLERQLLVAQRDAAVRQYGFVYESLQQLQAQTTDPVGLTIVERAFPRPVVPRGLQVGRSRTSRMVLAGILGLLGGVAVALGLERLDPRLWKRDVVERALRAPVLAEIPPFPRAPRGTIVTDIRPRSFAADAFRLLSTGVRHALAARRAEPSADGDGDPRRADSDGEGRVVLVTSAGPTEGKTTVVANLAVALSELGKRVIVLSCDFRRPVVHRYFRVPNDWGLADVLASPNGVGLDRALRWTHLDNVRLVPSGPPPERPGELLGSERMRDTLREARERADYVLLDTSPLLGAGDAAPLLSEVDGVLVVAHARRTTVEVATRLGDLLHQLEAPVLGVALNGAEEAARARRYHWYYGSLASAAEGGGFPRLVRHRDEA
jgi:capsular exopolysaccharide synthesis family protein